MLPRSVIYDDGAADVVYYHLSSKFAQSVVIMTQVVSAFFGISVFDLVCHFSFDMQLIFSKGWTEPRKVIARVNYLLCRYTSPSILITMVIFMTSPIGNCSAAVHAMQALYVINLNTVSFIFVHRTMIIWEWETRVVLPLTLAWLCVVGASIVAIPKFGDGVRIADTKFCLYVTERQPGMPYTLTSKLLCFALDLTVMSLTLQRLLEGGLRSIYTGKGRRFIGATTLSKTLARQGVQIFCVQNLVDVFFLILYWSFPTTDYSFQMAGSALVFCLPTILAGKVYRDTRKEVGSDASSRRRTSQTTAHDNASPPESQQDSRLCPRILRAATYPTSTFRRQQQQQQQRHRQYGEGSKISFCKPRFCRTDDVEKNTCEVKDAQGTLNAPLQPLLRSHTTGSSISTSLRTISPLPTDVELRNLPFESSTGTQGQRETLSGGATRMNVVSPRRQSSIMLAIDARNEQRMGSPTLGSTGSGDFSLYSMSEIVTGSAGMTSPRGQGHQELAVKASADCPSSP